MSPIRSELAPSDMTGLLVGYGSIGRRHLENLHALGVTDWGIVHTGNGTLPLDPPGPVRGYRDLGDALDAETPTFAVIANPTSFHLASALACVERGCDVLIEKPLSHSTAGLEALADATAANGAHVLMGFQFRFHPALRRIDELLERHTLGAPLHARVIWGEYLPSWHPWEDWRAGYAAQPDLGGGVHHTICHPFDYLHMLFGAPSDVLASICDHGPLGLDVPESADVRLRFPGGAVAQVHLDYWSRPITHRVEIYCSDGTIEWDYVTGAFRSWDSVTERWHSESFPGLESRNELFLSEARHFLEVIRGTVTPVCTLEDGMRTVRLCAAIERSYQTGAQLAVE